MRNKISSVIVCLTAIATSSVSADQHNSETANRARMDWGPAGDGAKLIIDRAYTAHKALKGVPASVTSNAECVVIVPGLTTAAIGVGGSHGDGVALCKTMEGYWSNPAFVDFDAASLGLQVGAKSSDVIVYLTSKKAATALKNGAFMFGADASVVAGNFERTFDTQGADAVVYKNDSGAYLGASIGAGKITPDSDSNKAFYGREVVLESVLTGSVKTTNESAKMLTKQLS